MSENALLLDWAGTAHAPAHGTARIASLVPSLTELLFALDLGPQVVARTGFCVHPREAVRAVPRVGGTKDPDLAQLRALAPTHLVVNIDENRREVVDKARTFIPHIVVTHPQVLQDNVRLYGLFGALFAREREAALLTTRFATALAALDVACASLARERVLYLIWKKPWMSVARDTYVSATLARAGWDTLPARSERRYPALLDGDAAWGECDRVLMSSEPYAFRPRDAQALQQRIRKPVTLIDGEWTSWYGPRAIPGMDALADLRIRLARETTAAP
jgi:ABC-type Fe3+-hydroxamate transport system substrate-binding protein